MFLANYMGQIITDHSVDIFNALWVYRKILIEIYFYKKISTNNRIKLNQELKTYEIVNVNFIKCMNRDSDFTIVVMYNY